MSLSNISLAIPDTFCTNYQNTLQKNIAVGEIGRICSIFKINKIFIYSEKKNKPNKEHIIISIIDKIFNIDLLELFFII